MALKDRHEPNEVAFGQGNSGKPGNVDLHPGPPQRNGATGKVDGTHSTSFYPNEPGDRGTAVAKQAPQEGETPTKSSSPRVS